MRSLHSGVASWQSKQEECNQSCRWQNASGGGGGGGGVPLRHVEMQSVHRALLW